MPRSLGLATLLPIALAATCSAAEPANLVKNPGFETVTAARPADWSLTGAASLDDAQFYAGRTGLRMVHTQPATSAATQTLTCGERDYVALAWVKVVGVTGTGARVRLRGPAGQAIAVSPPLTGETTWQAVRVPFNPGSIGRVSVELSLAEATGSAWFDDIVVADAAAVGALAQTGAPAPTRTNVALGKPYELSPPPSYEYCSDPGDNVQLTDGKYTVGYFWTQKSTVGWYLYSPQITLDLGRVEPIAGITINCPGGGAAGVAFPRRVTYLVSDDNASFYEVAGLTPRGLRQDGKSWYTHRFLADGLQTRGRYVMIRLDKAGSTVFADEVEVYRGDHDPATVQHAGPARNRSEMAFAQYSLTPRTYTRGESPVTPHVKWATPLSGGPIRSILMAYSGDMREAVEIAQRVDLDYTPVSHHSFYSAGTLGTLMQDQITRALPACEVMVVGGYRWEATGEALLERIQARVREGMGLVCVTPTPAWLKPLDDVFRDRPLAGDEGLLDLVPMSLIPAYRKPRGSHLHLGTYGKGRVAWVNWAEFGRGGHSLIPSFMLEDIDDDANGPWEYSLAALAKLVGWAAGRDLERIVGITCSARGIRVQVDPGEAAGTLEVVTRDRFFDPLDTHRLGITPAGGSFELAAVGGINGCHPVDVWLRDARGAVVDFGSASYECDNGAGIEAVTLSRPYYAPGEPVEALVKLRGHPLGLRLTVSLIDTYGRVTEAPQTPEVTAAGEARVQLPNRHPLTLATHLALALRRGEQLIDRRMERVWIDLPRQEDYTFCAWYAWDFQPTAFHGLRMLRDLGLDTYVSLPGKWRAESAAYANLRHGPENVERVAPQNKDESLVRVPCLTDPQYRARTAARIEAMAREVRPYGVTEWSMGDESTLGGRDYCVSPTCLAAFRTYLQQQYKDLAALNEGWDTHFGAWEEVVPLPRTQVEKRDNLAPWLDHRRYMESLFASYHDWCRQLVTGQIPRARVGISGTPGVNSTSGHDWWKLMQGPLTHLSGYGGVQRELQRSFMMPGTFYTTFLGYDYKDNDEQRARYSPWDLVFHGSGGVNYYTMVSDTLNCPLVRPDMTLTAKAPWFLEEVRELKAGMGRLFMAAGRERDGIAVHYSPASIHAATAGGLFDHRDRLRNYNINLSNVGKILEQCHLQYDFIHEEQMARGELRGYRLLILPWSSAVSAREAAAITAFVRGGGTVLADCYCAVRDDHGKPRAMLEELFGVRQPLAPPQLEAGTMKPVETISAATPRVQELFAGLPAIPVASGSGQIVLAGGTPLAQVAGLAACIVNTHGAGRAIFLNSCFSNYAEVWASGVAGEVLDEQQAPLAVTAPIREFITRVARVAGVRAPLTIDTETGVAAELEVSRFALDKTRLIGVVRTITAGAIDRSDVQAYHLTLPAPAHIYDSRGGRYLGRSASISDQAARGVARVYAALPYEIAGLGVHGPSRAAPGDAIRVRTTLFCRTSTFPATHVIRLTVSGPDGAERPHYAQNLVTVQGSAETEVPFAYNDLPGLWTIAARDVVTGAQGRLVVAIRGEL